MVLKPVKPALAWLEERHFHKQDGGVGCLQSQQKTPTSSFFKQYNFMSLNKANCPNLEIPGFRCGDK